MKKRGKGFVRKILECVSGEKRQWIPEKSEEKQIRTEEAGADKTQAEKPEKKDYKFMGIAWKCEMGDMEAMIELAEWFRSRFSPKLEELVAAYEESSDDNRREVLQGFLQDYVRNSPDDSFYGKAYMMWIVRAALYGNARAEKIMEKCPYYETGAYVPCRMFSPMGRYFQSYWASNSLRELGLLQFPEGKTDCGLVSLNKKGYFDFYYVSWYSPPDEDGFGREEEYEDIYYDEFFNRIRTENVEEIEEELVKLENRRERYWAVPENDAAARKYRKRQIH